MRSFPLLLCLGLGALASAPLACSSSDDAPPPGTSPEPDGGTGNADGDVPQGDGDLQPDGAKVVYVKTTTESFMHAGAQRVYILSVPVDYDASKKYPVYMFMHGNPGDANGMLASYPVDGVTKTSAIVVYPDALTENWDHTALDTDNDDVTYLRALIEEVAAKVSIDKGRILLAGWSGGGFMASQVACRDYALFRAIGVYSGGAPYDPNETDPNAPSPACAGASIATFVVHGQNDTSVDPSSGTYAAQYWAAANGCSDTQSAATPTPCVAYDGCPPDKPVGICMVPGAGHGLWSGAHAAAWAWFQSLP